MINKKIDNYLILEKLGDGTNGSVYIVEDKKKHKYILKYYSLVKDDKKLANETKVLETLNNYPNTIKYIKNSKFQQGHYILFEYLKTKSLQHYIKEKYEFSLNEAMQMIKDIAIILKYLLKNNILHTDIKAGNIVYDGKKFYLIDFGHATYGTYIKNLNVEFNSLYSAPELYDGVRSIESEIYSLGCIFYYMLTGGDINSMFGLTNNSTKAQKIYAHIYLKANLDTLPSKSIPLCQSMTATLASNRITLEDLLLLDLEIFKVSLKTCDSTFDIYKKMAEDNIEYGLYKMGLFYEKGFYVSQDLNKAKVFYNKAILKGSVKAYFHLGRLLLEDNPSKAKEYFQIAYAMGFQKALIYLDNIENKIEYLFKEYEKFKDKKNYVQAIKYMQSIVKLQPKSSYYNLLGILYKRENRIAEAIESFKQGLLLEAGKKVILMNLVDIYNKIYDFDNADKSLQIIKNLYPNDAATYRKYAILYKNKKKFPLAIEAYEKALELRPQSAEIKNELGQLYILVKNFKKGFELREGRLELAKNKSISSLCNSKKYEGQALKGKTIFVYREQGLGDTIHYIRYLPLLQKLCKKIIFRVEASLKELLEEVNYTDEIILNNESIKDLKYDYHVSLLSLAHFFLQFNYEIPNTTPYLKLPQDYSFPISINKNKFNIGIAWEGGVKSVNNKLRNIDLKYFSQLFSFNAIDIYSLHLSRQNKTIYEYKYENNIIDISGKLHSMMDTAKVIQHMDLVISVDTSILHLAGALGKKTWLPMQYLPEYRWGLEDEYSYWYPTVQIFREIIRKEDGNWDRVFQDITKQLEITLKAR
ncbi:MAG: protein kinase [Sulfurimonas sp.]|nr:protein kinase [Sulfurimonas sp.]